MRASIFRGGELVVDTMKDPEPGKGQILVRTLACGICGSDLHAMHAGVQMVEQWKRAGIPATLDFQKDIVFGHEYCAEVIDYGPGTNKRFATGTRVTGIGGPGFSNDLPGGYGQLMVVDEAAMLEVTNGLPSDQAAMTEPMAVGLHAVNKARLGPGDMPLVIGCGPVGLAVIAALKQVGVGPIVAADFSPARRRLAERLGADVVVDPGQHSPYTSWVEASEKAAGEGIGDLIGRTGAQRTAVVFECTGRPGITQQILENVPAGARLVMVGACMKMDQFEPMLATLKEVNIQFSVAYTQEEFTTTLHNLVEGLVDVAPLITSTTDLDGVTDAIRRLSDPETEAKIMIEPNGLKA